MATTVISGVDIEPIELEDLTTAQVDGTGVFDVLMQATKGHLDQEFKSNRIKGTEYATVYLGSLEHVLVQAVEFLLNKNKSTLEALLTEKQIELAGVEVQKAQVELQIAQQNLLKIPAEIALLEAQALLVGQQTLNAAKEREVLDGQICKLKAEYDAIMATLEKTGEEAELLRWKAITEKAQTTNTGVDPDSVIGKQKQLYQAQADGFKRDAEQKAAKVMTDTWNVRRTTDESSTPADSTNKLSDTHVGRAISKLLDGVGA